jgi:acetylornithine deacetylase
MGRVLTQLEALDRQLQLRPAHARLGAASLHASIISGGREWSSYPDACRLDVERRTLPGETAADAEAEVRAILERLRSEDPAFDASSRLVLARPSYEILDGDPLPQTLARVTREMGIESPLAGLSFWTDAAVLGDAGVPSVLFGPGGAGLHTPDEHVRIADVIACRDVLARLAIEWCAPADRPLA